MCLIVTFGASRAHLCVTFVHLHFFVTNPLALSLKVYLKKPEGIVLARASFKPLFLHFSLVAFVLIFRFSFFSHNQLFNLLALLLASLLPFYPFSNLSLDSHPPSSMASSPLNLSLTLVILISPLLLIA
jgi:hypothetical protein